MASNSGFSCNQSDLVSTEHREPGAAKKVILTSLRAGSLADDAATGFLSESRGGGFASRPGAVADQASFGSLGSSPPGASPLTGVIHEGRVRAAFVGQIEGAEMAALLETLV